MYFFSVLYNPGANALINVRNSILAGFKPIIYLNKVSDDFLVSLKGYDVVILGDNVNAGLGVAFNEVGLYLQAKDAGSFIYFDQDTIVSEDAWRKISETYMNYIDKDNVGVIYYNDLSLNKFSNVVISSGCFFSIRALGDINYHDKTYFVEGVDYDVCLRLSNAGYKIKSIVLDGIDHKTLQDRNIIKVFGKEIDARLYGWHRLKDFNISHFKLLYRSLVSFNFSFFLYFLRSLVLFNFGQLYNKVLTVVFKC